MSLRRRLFALVAAALLPLAVMAGVGLYALQRQQRAQTERVGLSWRAPWPIPSTCSSASPSRSWKRSPPPSSLDAEDITAFRERARRVIGSRPEWAAIILTDADGRSLMDTAFTAATAPTPAETESLARAVSTRAPAIGNLARLPHGEWRFMVKVPVLRGANLRYVLRALVKPDAIRNALVRRKAGAVRLGDLNRGRDGAARRPLQGARREPRRPFVGDGRAHRGRGRR